MKVIILPFVILLMLTACSQSKIEEYNAIIDKSTRIEIVYKDLNKRVELDNQQVEVFKDILKRNIEPTIQKKYKAEIQIDLYHKEDRIGFLIVTNKSSNPFVNFGSENLNFGYQLTYGIGQYLNEIK